MNNEDDDSNIEWEDELILENIQDISYVEHDILIGMPLANTQLPISYFSNNEINIKQEILDTDTGETKMKCKSIVKIMRQPTVKLKRMQRLKCKEKYR